MKRDVQLQQLIDFYETINPQSVRVRLGQIYARDAHFKDPFNDVRGIEPIAAIFTHMFAQVDAPRFVIKTRVLEGSQAFITWDFLFAIKRMPNVPQCVRGATHIGFDADGAVELHRDYWDVAEELYEKLPLLGPLMRWLKRRANR